MYKVVSEFKVKVKGEIVVMVVGSVIDLPETAAQMFIEQGKIEKVFEPVDDLNERMAIMGENCSPDETFFLTPEVKAKASDLYDAYKTWCDTNGEFILTQRNFGSRLTQKGLERVKSNGNFWKGVGIKN